MIQVKKIRESHEDSRRYEMKQEFLPARVCDEGDLGIRQMRATFPSCIKASRAGVIESPSLDILPDINKHSLTKQRDSIGHSWSSPEKKNCTFRSNNDKSISAPPLVFVLESNEDEPAGFFATPKRKLGQRRGRALERSAREDVAEPQLRTSAVRDLRTSAERQARFSGVDTAQMRRLAEERAAHATREASGRAKKLLDEAAAKKRASTKKRLQAESAREQRRAEVYARNAIMGEMLRRSLKSAIARMKAEANAKAETAGGTRAREGEVGVPEGTM